MDESGPQFQKWWAAIRRNSCQGSAKRDVSVDELQPATSSSLAICRFGFYRILGDWWNVSFRVINVRNDCLGTYGGVTLLMMAAVGNSVDIVSTPLKDSADLFAQDDYGLEALVWASSWSSESVVRLVLDQGLDEHTRAGKLEHALHTAARLGRESIVRLLLDNGANIHVQGDRRSALEAAAYSRNEAIARLLLDQGADVNSQGQGPL
jgi:ankyrin repeat protein